MKIVQLITRLDDLGGAQMHLRDLVVELKAEGHDVSVITGKIGPVSEYLVKHGVNVIHLHSLVREIHPFFDLKAALTLRDLLIVLKPDLIATHSSKAGLIGRIIGANLGIPTIFTAHGWAFTEGVSYRKRKTYQLLERLAAPFSSRVITVSNYDYELALKHQVIQDNKLSMVWNGVKDFPNIALSTVSSPIPKIVMVARFAEPKDHLSLVKALNELRTISWELQLIGDGPMKASIEHYVDSLQLGDKIKFLGSRNDVESLLSQADIFVLLSKYEGLPLSLIEALRAGLPVIASNVGGVKEIILNNKNGYLVNPEDKSDLILKLMQLILSSETRSRMGKLGRRIYEESFTFEKMMNQTLSIYKTALNDHHNLVSFQEKKRILNRKKPNLRRTIREREEEQNPSSNSINQYRRSTGNRP
ncbi:glycosyltransferase family 4 protein [Metabacillus sp. FJAT-52054]|uniref:Glycosyltransferase family 4 protein n=1 Tax=Metabacillus sediminis TaxID=3117746 RepID=A0ABZ2NCS1_9BACI